MPKDTTVQSLTERFEGLKTRERDLEKREVELTTKVDGLKETYKKTMTDIKERFGVGKLDAAQKLYDEKKTKLDSQLNTLSEKLNQYDTVEESLDTEDLE